MSSPRKEASVIMSDILHLPKDPESINRRNNRLLKPLAILAMGGGLVAFGLPPLLSHLDNRPQYTEMTGTYRVTLDEGANIRYSAGVNPDGPNLIAVIDSPTELITNKLQTQEDSQNGPWYCVPASELPANLTNRTDGLACVNSQKAHTDTLVPGEQP